MTKNEKIQQTVNEINQRHLYLLPHPLLRSAIAHYTYMQNRMFDDQPELVLVPDAAGCIIVKISDQGLECRFWGGTTTCVKVKADAESIYFHFFIEFLPGGAFSFLHHSQAIYVNQQVALDQIDKVLTTSIIEAYESSNSLKDFVAAIDQAFLRLLDPQYSCVQHIQKQIRQGHSIIHIADQIGYSMRHTQRLFQTQVGCSMKQYQRIERINLAVHYLQTSTYPLAQIAQLCGYFDESHFLHDFQSVMLISPRTYQKQMSDFYNEAYKF